MATLKEKLEEAAVELSMAKYELAEAQKRFDELFKQAQGRKNKRIQAQEKVEKATNPPDSLDERLIARIEDYLFRHKQEPHKVKEIAEAIGSSVHTVRTLLYRLKKIGKALRVSRGMWQAQDYETMSKFRSSGLEKV